MRTKLFGGTLDKIHWETAAEVVWTHGEDGKGKASEKDMASEGASV